MASSFNAWHSPSVVNPNSNKKSQILLLLDNTIAGKLNSRFCLFRRRRNSTAFVFVKTARQ